jgi:predicted DNA-binding ribbon-helix-helix protein
MMAKPKAIQWLEEETGQTIDYRPEVNSGQDRHLSVRLTRDLATGLDAMAAERGLTMSHLVRELIAEAVGQRASVAKLDGRALAERLAADVAEVRRRLAG